jgi:hypothetical protein
MDGEIQGMDIQYHLLDWWLHEVIDLISLQSMLVKSYCVNYKGVLRQ